MPSPVDDAYNSEYNKPTESGKLLMPFFRGRYRLSGKTYLGGSAIVKIGVDEKTNAMVSHSKYRPTPWCDHHAAPLTPSPEPRTLTPNP